MPVNAECFARFGGVMSYDDGHFFPLLRRCGHFAAVLLTQVLLLFKGAKDSLYAIVYKFKRKGDPL